MDKDKQIESLREEIKGWIERTMQAERQWDEAWHISQSKMIDLARERDEARQANAEKLELLQRIKTEMNEFGRLVGIELDTSLEQKAAAYNAKVRGLEQANAALLEGLRDIRDNPTYGIFYKRFNHVLDLLAQYDTAPKEDKTNE